MQHGPIARAQGAAVSRLRGALALMFGESAGRGRERALAPRLDAGEPLAVLLGAALSGDGTRVAAPDGVAELDWLALVLVDVAELSEDDAAEVLGLDAAEVGKRRAAAREAIDGSGRSYVVVLEDNALCRTVLDQECVGQGFALASSTAWPEIALAAARLFRPRLAVVDIDLNGAELAGDLAAMQIRETSPDCHVLFVTGYPMADKIAALMDNASAVVKPFRTSEITAAIQVAR